MKVLFSNYSFRIYTFHFVVGAGVMKFVEDGGLYIMLNIPVDKIYRDRGVLG